MDLRLKVSYLTADPLSSTEKVAAEKSTPKDERGGHDGRRHDARTGVPASKGSAHYWLGTKLASEGVGAW